MSFLTRAWPALLATAVLVFVLLRLAFDRGGYFPASFTSAAAIVFIALAVLAASVLQPSRVRLSEPALVAIAALAGLACWTGLSRAWSSVPDVALLDMRRAMLYLGLFGLALLAADSARNARLLLWSLLGVIVVIATAGLLSRLQPDLVSTAADEITRSIYRLAHPLGYWNALGALASMGVMLAVGLAADVRGTAPLRCAAAGAALLLAVTMYLSLSRGAWLALIVGLVVLVGFAPNRGSLMLTLAVVGAATVVAILRLKGYPALVLDPEAGSGQASQGGAFTRDLLLLLVIAVAAQAALTAVRMPRALERWMRAIRGFTLIGGAALVVVAAVIGYVANGSGAEGRVTAAVDDTTDWLDRQWQDFLDSGAQPAQGTARLVTIRGARGDTYRVAIDGFEARPVTGGGAGSFEVRYARDRAIDVKARDAHSLPLETLSELGAVGMLLLLAFFGAIAAAARRALAGKGSIRPAEAAAVIAAVAVWLGHASVDWGWEMPAVTGTALVLAAVLFASGRRRRSRARESPGARRRHGHIQAQKAH